MDINVTYDVEKVNELCEIMRRHGSDKGTHINDRRHNYTRYYYPLFLDVRNEKLRIFELGLGTDDPTLVSNMTYLGPGMARPGASLRGWKEFFPNSEIYGADIDKKILFEEDRIKTYYCDQTSPRDIHNMWMNEDLDDDFDIIIDDGLHRIHANRIFFENSCHKLKVGGIFIIEDVGDQINGAKLVEEIKTTHSNFSVKLLIIDHPTNKGDNNLIVVKRNY